jgi:hypothetical protein
VKSEYNFACSQLPLANFELIPSNTMKNLTRSLNLCAILFVFCTFAYPQQNESETRKALRITGKVTTVLAKATARAAFETAKFAGKHVIVPAVKNVGVPMAKAAPPLMVKAAKLSAKGIRKGVKLMSRDHDEDKTTDPDPNGSGN